MANILSEAKALQQVLSLKNGAHLEPHLDGLIRSIDFLRPQQMQQEEQLRAQLNALTVQIEQLPDVEDVIENPVDNQPIQITQNPSLVDALARTALDILNLQLRN